MGAKNCDIEFEIENARLRPRKEKELQRIYNARKAAKTQVQRLGIFRNSLDKARELQNSAREKKTELQKREVELAKEVCDGILQVYSLYYYCV